MKKEDITKTSKLAVYCMNCQGTIESTKLQELPKKNQIPNCKSNETIYKCEQCGIIPSHYINVRLAILAKCYHCNTELGFLEDINITELFVKEGYTYYCCECGKANQLTVNPKNKIHPNFNKGNRNEPAKS